MKKIILALILVSVSQISFAQKTPPPSNNDIQGSKYSLNCKDWRDVAKDASAPVPQSSYIKFAGSSKTIFQDIEKRVFITFDKMDDFSYIQAIEGGVLSLVNGEPNYQSMDTAKIPKDVWAVQTITTAMAEQFKVGWHLHLTKSKDYILIRMLTKDSGVICTKGKKCVTGNMEANTREDLEKSKIYPTLKNEGIFDDSQTSDLSKMCDYLEKPIFLENLNSNIAKIEKDCGKKVSPFYRSKINENLKASCKAFKDLLPAVQAYR